MLVLLQSMLGQAALPHTWEAGATDSLRCWALYYLQERHVVHDGPIGEALNIAQIAQVVPVAPQLILQLCVGDGRAVHIVVQCGVVLGQPPGQVAHVVVHLQVASQALK